MEIVPQHFQVMDWFPRSPGLYYTPVPHGPETKRNPESDDAVKQPMRVAKMNAASENSATPPCTIDSFYVQ